jgi:hypothetical protein
VFDRHFRGNGRGVSYGPLSIAVRPQSAPGANDSLALRLATRLTTGRLSARFTVDVLAFRLGPALVTLVAAGLGAPFPAADEQRLFSLLLARAIPRPL